MADISVTAANVVPASGYKYTDGIAGETITAGQLVYLKAADNEYYKTDNDASATATVAGVALNGASNGQPIRVQHGGNINPGGTVVVGTIYCSSSTEGGIAPSTDLASGDYVSVIGIGTTASNIALNIHNSGVAVPE